jgi:hypothetical protein
LSESTYIQLQILSASAFMNPQDNESMPKPTANSEKLRAALIAEKSDAHARMLRYKLLTTKIAEHQVGHGPAPTEEEFTQWLADVKYAVDLKKMMGGG